MPAQTRSMTRQLRQPIVEYGMMLNMTTNEWFWFNNETQRVQTLKELLKKLKTDDVILKGDVGTSRWKRTDIIKCVPKTVGLEDYVKTKYTQIEPIAEGIVFIPNKRFISHTPIVVPNSTNYQQLYDEAMRA